jgi:hypothetical protein
MKTHTPDRSKIPAALQSLHWQPIPAVFDVEDRLLVAFADPCQDELTYIINVVWIGTATLYCNGCGMQCDCEAKNAHWYVKLPTP